MSKVEGFIDNVLKKIPGYLGYRDKESRRDEDKRIRVAAADSLVGDVDQLTAYSAELARQRDFTGVTSVESVIGQVRLLADRVRTTSYGYGGIFSDTDIDANVLEQLRQFDAALLRETDSLSAAVQTLTSSTPPVDGAVKGVQTELDRLVKIFDTRGSVVTSAIPATDAEALKLLAIPEKIEPSPLLSVKKGDALSVLGDNYIANATIRLRAQDGEILLARVSEDQAGATWMLGSSVSGIQSAQLTETSVSAGGYQTMNQATATIDTETGQEADVASSYAYRDLGDNRVEFAVSIGDTIKSFEGSTIVDKDIEVYGVA